MACRYQPSEVYLGFPDSFLEAQQTTIIQRRHHRPHDLQMGQSALATCFLLAWHVITDDVHHRLVIRAVDFQDLIG